MPRGPATFRQSDVERAIHAARRAGLTIGRVEVTRDGTIRIVEAQEAEAVPATPFDKWKAKQDAG